MFYFVLAVPVLIIMYTDKDSNLISDLSYSVSKVA